MEVEDTVPETAEDFKMRPTLLKTSKVAGAIGAAVCACMEHRLPLCMGSVSCPSPSGLTGMLALVLDQADKTSWGGFTNTLSMLTPVVELMFILSTATPSSLEFVVKLLLAAHLLTVLLSESSV